MISLWRQAGLGTPRVNQHVWSGDRLEEVDLHSRQLGLVAEADGGRYHGSRWRRRRDAEKDARLRAAGWIVGRYPDLQITLEPASVTADLRQLAAVGRRNPAVERIPCGGPRGGHPKLSRP
jgi:very-short-patch-repair endonuclease